MIRSFTRSLVASLVLCLCTTVASQAQYTLQLLHASDLEGGVSAIGDAPRFAALVDTFENSYPNTLLLSAGDNYIPGPFFAAAADAAVRDSLRKVYNALYNVTSNGIGTGAGRVDIAIMNVVGFDGSAFGNHEWDASAGQVVDLLRPGSSWTGAQFPYLSANLNLRNESSLRSLFVPGARDGDSFTSPLGASSKRGVAASVVYGRGGDSIGVVGLTTPLLQTISSPAPVTVNGPGAGTNNVDSLAAVVQPYIDSLTSRGINKIIIVSHLQQFALEQALAPKLTGVDIIVAGGSSAILADANDRLRQGDVAFGTYPFLATSADSKPVAIVSSGEQYQYLGRLVVQFNAAGEIIPSSIDANVSGSYATDSAGVVAAYGNYASAFGTGSKASLVKTLVDAVAGVVSAKDSRVVGRTSVYLEGRRTLVRTQETNLGNLTADANLWYAQQYDQTAAISLKNGGGIRGEIGQIENGTGNLLPPVANPLVSKQAGDISSLDVENSLRFNNTLSLVTITAPTVKRLYEHGVASWTPTSTPGSFGQVGGVRFSFDPSLPAQQRIRNLAVIDAAGAIADIVVQNGSLVGDTNRTFRMVTLNFLANGGDGYPFGGRISNRVDLDTIALQGSTAFFSRGGEQHALAEYLTANTLSSPYAAAETDLANDFRIQNLSARPDAVLSAKRNTGGTVMTYPNPASSTLHIGTEFEMLEAHVTDLNGRQVLALPVHGRSATAQLGSLHPGIYLLQVATSRGITTSRISVLR